MISVSQPACKISLRGDLDVCTPYLKSLPERSICILDCHFFMRYGDDIDLRNKDMQ